MIPTHFDEENCTLQGREDEDILDLPVFRGDGEVISCWRPSWRERLSVLFFGRVWLRLLHPRTQPPSIVEAYGKFPRQDLL